MINLLKGTRVLDLSRLLPGPFCSMTLADMGAEVLKVEDTGLGDYMRTLGPIVKKESIFFLMLNRNKKSMKLNLKSEEGKEIFKRLAKEYDVILESFRPGVMDRLGVGYEEIKKINPKIIYCSLTGFGQTGPYRNLAGHDQNYLSFAGVLDSIGPKDGPPVMPGVQIADIGGGALWAAIAILAAVVSSQKDGKGQYIDVAMMDGAMPFLGLFTGHYFVDGTIPQRGETVETGADACTHVYETKDGRYISLIASEPQFWKRFCEGIGKPELIPLQYSPEPRRSEIIDEVSSVMRIRTQAEWNDILLPLDVCYAPVKNISEALNDPQVKARNMLIEVDHPVEGKTPSFAFPVKFPETLPQINYPAPQYGEHTAEVLKGIGYSTEQIKALESSKVI